MSKIPFIISGDSITVFDNGVQTYPNSHVFYKEICEAVKNNDLVSLREAVSKKFNKNGLEIKDNIVTFNGEPLNNVAVNCLFEAKKAGFDTEPFVKFLENCQKNPYPIIVDKLYEFLESRGMPLTEDGCFIGYKYCNSDYWDSHTGRTYQFIPNTHVEANNIEDICDTSGEECSNKGIHVGNWEYSGGQPTVVFVKVNPKDVLSVPHGYGAKKIRVWRLDVLDRVDGKKDEVVVTSEGKKIGFIKGNYVNWTYKNGDGKFDIVSGTIHSVGDTYLELVDGKCNKEKFDKKRLKISNIQD